jgi:hypothetical protein
VDVLRVSCDLSACPTAKQKPETAAATSKAAGSGFYALARLLEHDAEKWVPVFRKTSCSSNNLKRDGDSKKSHPALEASPVARLSDSLASQSFRLCDDPASDGLGIVQELLDAFEELIAFSQPAPSARRGSELPLGCLVYRVGGPTLRCDGMRDAFGDIFAQLLAHDATPAQPDRATSVSSDSRPLMRRTSGSWSLA